MTDLKKAGFMLGFHNAEDADCINSAYWIEIT
jgi:hypothetical protein